MHNKCFFFFHCDFIIHYEKKKKNPNYIKAGFVRDPQFSGNSSVPLCYYRKSFLKLAIFEHFYQRSFIFITKMHIRIL